jgi:hypothetical protein
LIAWDAASLKTTTNLQEQLKLSDHTLDEIKEQLEKSLNMDLSTLDFSRSSTIEEIVDAIQDNAS